MTTQARTPSFNAAVHEHEQRRDVSVPLCGRGTPHRDRHGIRSSADEIATPDDRPVRRRPTRRNGPTVQVDANGCWVWQGAVNDDGYGIVRRAQKNVRVHRRVFERLVGPIPDGMVLDHRCGNRRCCNPRHLRPVSNTANVRFGRATKLTEDLVRGIRSALLDGRSERSVAAEFGISPGHVNAIRHRRVWADVE